MLKINVEEVNILNRSLLLGSFLHDIGKLPARILKRPEDISSLLSSFTESKEILRGKIQKFKDVARFNHPILGLFLWVDITGGDVLEPLKIANEKEQRFYKKLGLNSYIVKSAILLHHLRGKDSESQLEDFLREEGLNVQEITLYSEAFDLVQRYLVRADNMEARGSREVVSGRYIPTIDSWEFQKQIYNILSYVNVGAVSGTRSALPLTELSLAEIDYIVEQGSYTDGTLVDKFVENLRELVNHFIKVEKNSQRSFEVFFSALNTLYKRFLMFIPADIRERLPIVSLYEHSYSVAALTSVFGSFSPLLKEEDSKKEVASFRILIGDFSGIQKYIFDLGTTKDALKRLKARSFKVQLELESIKEFIRDELNLPFVSEILNAGGKFILLLPELTDSLDEKFEALKHEIEKRVYERYKGRVSINLVLSEPIPFEDAKDFKKYLAETHRKLWENKNKPLLSVLTDNEWHTDLFVISKELEQEAPKLCPVCKREIFNEKEGEDICDNCKEEIRIARKIPYLVASLWLRKHVARLNGGGVVSEKEVKKLEKTDVDLLFHRVKLISAKARDLTSLSELQEGGLYPPEGYVGITFYNFPASKTSSGASKKRSTNLRRTKTYFKPILRFALNNNIPLHFNFLANYVPVSEQGVKSLQDLKKEGNYWPLAVLKGDIDSLGKIFMSGLDKLRKETSGYSFSLLRTLSTEISLFFELYTTHYLSRAFPNVYIAYAGGDDFVFIGSMRDIFNLAGKLYENWNRYLRISEREEPSVTFSAAIVPFREKEPIINIIQRAEENLHEAKYSSDKKGNIYVYDNVLPYRVFYKGLDEWIDILQGEEEHVNLDLLIDLLKEGIERTKSSTTVYRLFTLVRKLKDLVLKSGDKEDNESFRRENILISYIIYLIDRKLGVSRSSRRDPQSASVRIFYKWLERMRENLLNWALFDGNKKEILERLKYMEVFLNHLLYKLREKKDD